MNLTLGPPVAYVPRVMSLADFQRHPGIPFPLYWKAHAEPDPPSLVLLAVENRRLVEIPLDTKE